MAIKRVLLYLPTYPDAPTDQVMESAANFVKRMGGTLTAVIPELSADPATWPRLGAWIVDVPRMVAEAVRLSADNATRLAESMDRIASLYEVAVDIRKTSAKLFPSPQSLVDLTRSHDLLILPFPESNDFDRDFIQPAIFDTGRPTLLLPHGKGKKPLESLSTIAVAWDYSREGARAIGDAMSILVQAKRVRVFSVFGEKGGLRTTGTAEDFKTYLAAHGVKFELEEIPLKHWMTIGGLIGQHASGVNADILVMGAYGHSRLREFILGGATKSLISDPPLPVFLSH